MKRVFMFVGYCFLFTVANAQRAGDANSPVQNAIRDSLFRIVNLQKEDTNEVKALAALARQSDSPDSGIIYGERGVVLAKLLHYKTGEAECLFMCSANFGFMGNQSQCIYYALRALELYEELKNYRGAAEAKLILQGTYRDIGDNDNALAFSLSGAELSAEHNLISLYGYPGHHLAPLYYGEIAKSYLDRNQIDSSLIYTKKALDQNELFGGVTWNFPLYLLGRIQLVQKNYPAALKTFETALPLAVTNGFPWDTLQIFTGLAKYYLQTGKPDSTIYYSKDVIRNRNTGETTYVLETIDDLASAYKMKGEKDSVIRYIEFRDFYWDSISNNKKLQDAQNLAFNMKFKQQELASAQKRYQEQLRFYFMAAGLLIILLVAVFLWRHNRQRQKAFAILQQQKNETEQQKLKTEDALRELKDTQTQLIQSEKMASLGVLTSGIAHEIQNPLNFVNNFSEVNTELLNELDDEIQKGNIKSSKSIAEEIRKNEEKINLHGKRADSIVKSMLQHSRPATGKKESANINQLTEEYLRLSYLGIRSKDKSFQANMKTDFDPEAGKIDLIPEDIGRLLVNIFNNAFYAMQEKSRSMGDSYEPELRVSTKKMGNIVEIRVKDNGTGIPQHIQEKIFQPFFTTKPPGQGTGLGLSLSYDVIKAHGGEFRLESEEGSHAEFIIDLPVSG
jgi:two-component system, NtrC family, sensor kinase